MQRLRETGDPGLYARADMAFAEALERDPRSLEATVGAGTLALSRHDFRAALEHGQRARRLAPASFAPFAVIVDAQVELGRYDRRRAHAPADGRLQARARLLRTRLVLP